MEYLEKWKTRELDDGDLFLIFSVLEVEPNVRVRLHQKLSRPDGKFALHPLGIVGVDDVQPCIAMGNNLDLDGEDGVAGHGG